MREHYRREGLIGKVIPGKFWHGQNKTGLKKGTALVCEESLVKVFHSIIMSAIAMIYSLLFCSVYVDSLIRGLCLPLYFTDLLVISSQFKVDRFGAGSC